MKKLRVLLVDDEEEFVETLATRLEMRDMEANTVLDGEAALAAVKKDEPDVMVLDVKMPGMDGIEVLRKVKKAYPNVEVIILTGHGTEKDEETARRLGAFDYVKKPADIDFLAPRIAKAFKRRIKKLETMSMAAAFAEAGDFDSAREIMEEQEESEDDE